MLYRATSMQAHFPQKLYLYSNFYYKKHIFDSKNHFFIFKIIISGSKWVILNVHIAGVMLEKN